MYTVQCTVYSVHYTLFTVAVYTLTVFAGSPSVTFDPIQSCRSGFPCTSGVSFATTIARVSLLTQTSGHSFVSFRALMTLHTLTACE